MLNFFAAAIFFAVVEVTITFLVSDPPGFLAPGGSLVKLCFSLTLNQFYTTRAKQPQALQQMQRGRIGRHSTSELQRHRRPADQLGTHC